jgi:hypothetical protein
MRMMADATGIVLTPRPVRSSVEELVAGADSRTAFRSVDARSGSRFERVELNSSRYVLKVMHVDDDWIARSLGDVGCWQVRAWRSGLLDTFPSSVDHAVVDAAAGLGRNGWGAALLMHDVEDELVPSGREPIDLELHATFIAHMADLSARFWGWRDTVGLMPPTTRWSFFCEEMLDRERSGGWPNIVPAMAARGWARFAERAAGDVVDGVGSLRREPHVLSAALAATPATFLHGDWKMGNLGHRADGRTIVLDAYPGEGPACNELTWYLALNQERIPEPKEDVIARFRRELEAHGISTTGWWDRQLGLCLLGTVLQFGWEKGLGEGDELGWWIDRAREGMRWL